MTGISYTSAATSTASSCLDRKSLLELPEDKTYRIELIDTWGMTSTVLDGTFSGHSLITLPQLPYMAARLTAVPR